MPLCTEYKAEAAVTAPLWAALLQSTSYDILASFGLRNVIKNERKVYKTESNNDVCTNLKVPVSSRSF